MYIAGGVLLNATMYIGGVGEFHEVEEKDIES